MSSVNFYMNFLRRLGCALMPINSRLALSYAFMYYALFRLQRLLQSNILWQTLPDDTFETKLKNRLSGDQRDYIDRNSCILASTKNSAKHTSWAYVCCIVSLKKYKVLVVPFKEGNENEICISETMRCNLENTLSCSLFNNNAFILPIKSIITTFATEAKVSLIYGPQETANNVIDSLLENYFSEPKFLRRNDIFRLNVKEHSPDLLYSSGVPLMPVIHFKVNSMMVSSTKTNFGMDGSYVLCGETSLIQEPNVHSYLPRKYSSTLGGSCDEAKKLSVGDYPQGLAKPLEQLDRCISPFIRREIQLPLRPIFLVKGSQGCGKRRLIQIAAQKGGLNLLSIDFAEVQTLTSAQTEAKLRIVLHNARQSVPCILCLNNIEVFGKNAEGQKDERIISAFWIEVNSLYDKPLKHPLIIIATSDESEIPAELNRIFIETIYVDHLDQTNRADLIAWLLAKRGLKHEANLSRTAGMCSDFRVSDVAALILHAVKAYCKRNTESVKQVTLMQEDFDKAYEYMQSMYTDCQGAPRVPKVHWEDIGGLADLKHEITRRIQLPLLNAFGFGQSGLLLYGPPGTGKTLLAKAVATEYQLHFLSIKGPEVLNMYVGQSEKNVRQIFERARAAAPCIVFFDELDSLAPNRGRSGDSGGVMDRVVSQLLAEMDGLEGASSIFIIGATNRPDLIDPALLRPGRFDKMLYVGILSDVMPKCNVLEALTRKFTMQEDTIELTEVVNVLPKHITGADLYAVCSDAWLGAARKILGKHSEGQDLKSTITVEISDFLEAARALVPSVSKEEAERYSKMQAELSSVSYL